MVYITGDCHADFRKFSTRNFPEQKEMTRDDFVIVCGDFGLWHDSEEERYWLSNLEERQFTLLFVDGNHENFDRLYGNEFEVVNFHGGAAHKIRQNIFHLMRGYIYDLCGCSFFAFGGARSHDIQDGILLSENYATKSDLDRAYTEWCYEGRQFFRISHYSWWEQEMPSDEEIAFGAENLAKHDNKVDFIVSHCCSSSTQRFISRDFIADKLTSAFEGIERSVKFRKWYFGHYHRDEAIDDKHILMYNDIVRIV